MRDFFSCEIFSRAGLFLYARHPSVRDFFLFVRGFPLCGVPSVRGSFRAGFFSVRGFFLSGASSVRGSLPPPGLVRSPGGFPHAPDRALFPAPSFPSPLSRPLFSVPSFLSPEPVADACRRCPSPMPVPGVRPRCLLQVPVAGRAPRRAFPYRSACRWTLPGAFFRVPRACGRPRRTVVPRSVFDSLLKSPGPVLGIPPNFSYLWMQKMSFAALKTYRTE